MCMHRFNQKFCLVVLEVLLIVSYALVEAASLLSPGTSGVSRKSPAGAASSSPDMGTLC